MANPQHTPTYKVFYYPFICKIKAIHLYTDEQLECRGTVSTGNREYDQAMLNEVIRVSCTINQICEYYSQGVSVILENPKDSVRIYEIINEFLTGYKEALNNSLNFQVDDLEFIRGLDLLAADIYVMAKRYIKEEIQNINVLTRLANFGARGGLGNRAKINTTVQEEHRKVSDDISEQALSEGRRWR